MKTIGCVANVVGRTIKMLLKEIYACGLKYRLILAVSFERRLDSVNSIPIDKRGDLRSKFN